MVDRAWRNGPLWSVMGVLMMVSTISDSEEFSVRPLLYSGKWEMMEEMEEKVFMVTIVIHKHQKDNTLTE